MAKFALISNGDTILKLANYSAQPANVPHKNLTWLPYVKEIPAYDPNTETLNPATTVIEPTRVLYSATVRPLTTQELDARNDAQIDAISTVLFEVTFNHENRIRALESKAPITKAQLKAALKALI
jgi:hypothetical protein